MDSLTHLSWMPLQISNTTLVFDGGSNDTPPLTKPINADGVRHPWVSLRIIDGDLFVPDEPTPAVVSMYEVPFGSHTPFLRPPRKVMLSITAMDKFKRSIHFCKYLGSAYDAQKAPYVRGVRKLMFSTKKNYLLGTQPKRGSRVIQEKTYHVFVMPPP